MLMASFLVAAVTGFIGAAWALAIGVERWFWGVGTPCALMGFILGIVALDVVESTCLALYVCFAEASHATSLPRHCHVATTSPPRRCRIAACRASPNLAVAAACRVAAASLTRRRPRSSSQDPDALYYNDRALYNKVSATATSPPPPRHYNNRVLYNKVSATATSLPRHRHAT